MAKENLERISINDAADEQTRIAILASLEFQKQQGIKDPTIKVPVPKELQEANHIFQNRQHYPMNQIIWAQMQASMEKKIQVTKKGNFYMFFRQPPIPVGKVYKPNGAKEVARRKRQIEKGMIKIN